MAEFPALPLFTDSWIADTRHLTLEERCVYHDLLIVMWRTPGCNVPNDIPWLVRRLNIIEKDVTEIVLRIVTEFFQSDGNRLWQKRLLKEFEYCRKQSERRKSYKQKKKIRDRDTVPDAAPTPTPTPTPLKKERTYPSDTLKNGKVDNDQPSTPADLQKGYYDTGVAYLAKFGKAEVAARKLLGQWARDLGGFGLAAQTLGQAQTIGSPDPVAYMEGACAKHKKNRNGNGHTNGHAKSETSDNPVVGTLRWFKELDRVGYFSPQERDEWAKKLGVQ